MMIVDSHCHLNYPDRYDVPVSDIIARAKAANVGVMQTICTKLSEFDDVHAIALAHENVYCSVGVHPHHAGEEEVTADDIRSRGQLKKVIGIGETGLDYYYNNAPKDQQRESFIEHIDIARALDMPVIIHTRDAEEDTIDILTDALAKAPVKLLFHCFSSNAKIAEFGVQNNISFSASGIITFKKSEELRDIFYNIPNDLLMVETDSPYLAPEPHRGRTCEPAFTAHVLTKLAEVKGMDMAELANITTANFFNLFTKAARPIKA